MQAKVQLSCPLGSKCQDPKDGIMHQCAWFTKLAGQKADGEAVDEYACAMAWLPVLLIENAQSQRSTSAAVESFRNEMTVATEQGRQTVIALARYHDHRLNTLTIKGEFQEPAPGS